MRSRVFAAAVALAVLAGCSTGGPEPGARGWDRVTLPDGVRIASLAADADTLLAGGSVGSGADGSGQTSADTAPRLFVIEAGGVSAEVPLTPADPNAATASLVALTASGRRVYAIGKMVAGAHSNPRLTVWDGSAAEGLTSRPQEFFTFGGHDAGPLLGTVVVDRAPVIFGSRTSTTGTVGLLWTRKRETWTPQDPVPALTSSADRELGFTALAQLGGRLVVAGDEVGLQGGLTQLPAIFVGAVRGPWDEVLLPVPGDLAAVAGQLSRATSISCLGTGSSCWVAGWVRGHPVVWPVTIGDDPAPGAPIVLAGEPAADADPVAVATTSSGRAVVFTNAATPSLYLGCPDAWRNLGTPPAAVSAAVVVGHDLYAVAGDTLWHTDAPTC
ncbi:MAG: hypothetical protein QM779_09860 [Propionicimonas sp.]|uniref:hypothetical protein n=1 Tax=Propionicimonas sp. TaxID=1955623 RepID=UPI003D0F5F6B